MDYYKITITITITTTQFGSSGDDHQAFIDVDEFDLMISNQDFIIQF